MNRLLTAITCVLLFLAGLAGSAYYTGWLDVSIVQNGPPTSPSGWELDLRRGVRALGRIEPRDGIIDVSAIMGDRLDILRVSAGDPVQVRDELAVLESYKVRRMELSVLDRQIAEAEARLAAEINLANQQVNTARLSVREAKAVQLEIDYLMARRVQLEANLEVAVRDNRRFASVSTDVVSEQERDHQKLLVTQARAELAAADAKLKQLEETRELTEEGAALELAAAIASRDTPTAIPVKSLKQSRRLKVAQMRESKIKAPIAGTVLRTFIQETELVGSEPVLQLANLKHMVVVAEVHETEVRRLNCGQAANVTSDAFAEGEILTGKISRIGGVIASPALRSVNPMAPADIHVVEVRVELDPECTETAAQLVNLQVDVEFVEDESGQERKPCQDARHATVSRSDPNP